MSKLTQAELEQQERELEEQLRQLELESQELELLEQELEEAQEFEGSESRFAEEKDVVVPTAPIYDFTSTKTIKNTELTKEDLYWLFVNLFCGNDRKKVYITFPDYEFTPKDWEYLDKILPDFYRRIGTEVIKTPHLYDIHQLIGFWSQQFLSSRAAMSPLRPDTEGDGLVGITGGRKLNDTEFNVYGQVLNGTVRTNDTVSLYCISKSENQYLGTATIKTMRIDVDRAQVACNGTDVEIVLDRRNNSKDLSNVTHIVKKDCPFDKELNALVDGRSVKAKKETKLKGTKMGKFLPKGRMLNLIAIVVSAALLLVLTFMPNADVIWERLTMVILFPVAIAGFIFSFLSAGLLGLIVGGGIVMFILSLLEELIGLVLLVKVLIYPLLIGLIILCGINLKE